MISADDFPHLDQFQRAAPIFIDFSVPKPLNAVEQPADAPIVDRATIPLIARLVYADREEWCAVTARRWTDELVSVTWPPERGKPGGWCWLGLEDVRRVIVYSQATPS